MKRVIYTDKIKEDIPTKLYSDLHYGPNDDLSFLRKSINNIKIEDTKYVFFLGDMIDDSKYSYHELKELLEVLSEMSKYTKVILVYGNHEFYTKNSDGLWEMHLNYDLSYMLNESGVKVLQNEWYEDENISVYGLHFDGIYYECGEPRIVFESKIENITFERDRFNILMAHSPLRTFDSELINQHENLRDIDLTVAGHTHNGLVPWYMPMPTNIGLIDPYLKLFPRVSRGTKMITEKNHGIISVPLSTFSNRSKLGVLNKILYPPVEQNIILKKK